MRRPRCRRSRDGRRAGSSSRPRSWRSTTSARSARAVGVTSIAGRHRVSTVAAVTVAGAVRDRPDRFVEHDQAVAGRGRRHPSWRALRARCPSRCDHLVVHLHRLDQRETSPRARLGARLDEHTDDRSLQLRGHRDSHPTGLADGPGHSPRSDRRWYWVIDCSPITSSAATAANNAGTMKPGCPVVSATLERVPRRRCASAREPADEIAEFLGAGVEAGGAESLHARSPHDRRLYVGPAADADRAVARTIPAMARVVVTGGAGFLGSHLCRALLDRGDEVVAIDNLVTGSVANIEELFGTAGLHVRRARRQQLRVGARAMSTP